LSLNQDRLEILVIMRSLATHLTIQALQSVEFMDNCK